jgi:antitoxin HicB
LTLERRVDPCDLEAPDVLYRIPLVFSPQPEGGFTVTSPALPELVTEGDTIEEAYSEVRDALAAVVELYADQGRALPAGISLSTVGDVVWSEALVEAT